MGRDGVGADGGDAVVTTRGRDAGDAGGGGRRRRRLGARSDDDDDDAGGGGGAAWRALGVDDGVARALCAVGVKIPTATQRCVVPRALEGRDVVARASTGSGKTHAYLAPLAHALTTRGRGARERGLRAIVLAPTRELCHQVRRACAKLLRECAPTMRAGELPAGSAGTGALRQTAGSPPEVLAATPARVAECVREGYFPPGALEDGGLDLVVLDEADLLLSFGYVEDIKRVCGAVKRGTQTLMLSATMSAEIEALRDVVAHKPVVVDVEDDARDGEDATGGGGDATAVGKSGPDIQHYALRVPKSVDRLLYAMALLRLGLCKKKVLVFVSSADSAVRLRLFLHKFGVPTCALHGELPANSRTHILQEFNRGVYDFMVAAADDANMKETDEPVDEEEEDKAPTRESRKKKKDRRDKEFGVVRGIDFQAVNTVINFEVPTTAAAYVHRVGRTGRAGKSGTAITLVAPSEEAAFAAIQAKLESEVGETVAATQVIKPFDRLPKEAVDALRYRAEDAARAVGKTAVKEARVRELRQELLNSERLAAHFEDNAEDLALLKHDTSLAKHPDAKHLSHLPGYLRGSKSKRGDAKHVEPDSKHTKDAANYHLDVDVAEFGSKKKRKRNDRRETGPDLRVKNKFKKGNFKKKSAGRKRLR